MHWAGLLPITSPSALHLQGCCCWILSFIWSVGCQIQVECCGVYGVGSEKAFLKGSLELSGVGSIRSTIGCWLAIGGWSLILVSVSMSMVGSEEGFPRASPWFSGGALWGSRSTSLWGWGLSLGSGVWALDGIAELDGSTLFFSHWHSIDEITLGGRWGKWAPTHDWLVPTFYCTGACMMTVVSTLPLVWGNKGVAIDAAGFHSPK